jgi:exonuclease I
MRSASFLSNTVEKVAVDIRYDGQIYKTMMWPNYSEPIAYLWQNGAYSAFPLQISSDGAKPSEMRN